MADFDHTIEQEHALRRARLQKIGIILGAAILVLALLILSMRLIGDRDASPSADARERTPVQTEESAEDTALRAEAQQRLAAMRQRLQETEAKRPFVNFMADAFESLQAKLDEGVILYTQRDYTGALAQFNLIEAGLRTQTQRYQSAYTQAYEAASQAFAAENISGARRDNQRALTLNPEFAPAIALQARLDVYDDVKALLERAHVAMMENRFDAQRDYLQQVVLLDPAHQDAQEALAEVQATLQERAFLSALNDAVRHLEQGQLTQASSAANRADNLISGRAEVRDVRTRIQAAQTARELAAIEQQLTAFMAADEWATVAMVAGNALQKYPIHEASQNAQRKAQQITQTQARLQSYIQRPERLADLGILQNAQQALRNAEALANDSAKLAFDIDRLHDLVEEANRPVSVVLTSDGRTFVRVLGVGNVGVHQEYQFSLRPGVYQFEGRRDGYRSKIVSVTVTHQDAPVQVHVVCDERI